MKILFIIDSLGSGGSQRQMINIALCLHNKGYEIEFLIYFEDMFFSKVLIDNNIKITKIFEKNYFKRVLKIRKYIRMNNFNNIISFLDTSNFIAEISVFPKKKFKLIVGERSANPKNIKSFKGIFLRFFHIFADNIVSNSSETIKIVKEINPFLNHNKFKLIYNIVENSFFNSCDFKIINKDSKFKLVVIASHRYLKNLNGLVEAVNLLEERYKNKLEIKWYGSESGDNSKREALIKINKYKLNDIFKFYSSSENIKNIIVNSDAIGLFSIFEGLPNVICESMALKKIVVASNISDIPIFINNKNLIFNPNSALDISKSLLYVMDMTESHKKNEEENNFIIAKNHFNEELILQQYINLLSL